MNWRAIRTLIRRDLRVVVQSKIVMLPIILVPILFTVILPGGAGIFLSTVDENSQTLTNTKADMETFFANIPDSIQAELDHFNGDLQQLTYVVVVYFFAPMFLMMPVLVSNVIAADSFVGEKERKTLEALLYTPMTEREIYVAKVLAPWIAGTLVAIGSFVLYAITVTITTWPVMQTLYFPTWTWVVLALWVSPAAAGLGLGAMVLVSSRVKTFQEATQLGGMVVIPLVLLIISQFAGVVYLSLTVVLVLGLVLWLINIGILWFGASTFKRSRLISQV